MLICGINAEQHLPLKPHSNFGMHRHAKYFINISSVFTSCLGVKMAALSTHFSILSLVASSMFRGLSEDEEMMPKEPRG